MINQGYSNIVEQTEKALELVRNILSSQKAPRVLSAAEPHLYEDKYAVCDFVSTLTLNALYGLFDLIGLDKESLALVRSLGQHGQGNTLRFATKVTCEFVEEYEAKREIMVHGVDIDVTKKDTSTFNPSIPFMTKKSQQTTTMESRTFIKRKEYKWRFSVAYKIYIFSGQDDNPESDSSIVLKDVASSCYIVNTGKKETPIDVVPLNTNRDLSLTCLLKYCKPELSFISFSIDRSNDLCRTPRRNSEVDECQKFLNQSSAWFMDIIQYLIGCETLSSLSNGETESPSAPKLSSVDDTDVFNPVLPLLLSKINTEIHKDSAEVPMGYEGVTDLLTYHKKSIKEKIQTLQSLFPSQSSADTLCTFDNAHVILVARNAISLSLRWNQCIEYLEYLLHEQLTSAIGKVISSSDLQDFVRFYNQTFFADPYIPEAFCYAIRRPDHYPTGFLSIEFVDENKVEKESASSFQPIYTLTRKVPGALFENPLRIPINAATTVNCTCDRYLHGWVRQSFLEEEDDFKYQLAARARQFSSFLLIIGTLAGPDLFEPEHAIVVQNKDEVLIPLILNTLPSAKEFKDAISSLSPEQQNFAKTFRKKQLSSSIFGVCVVELKPQLELLLGLPRDSLTKEIKLMQELLQLFIDYQIPSDLLSFDGNNAALLSEKVSVVKTNVQAVMDVIDQAKQDSLDQAKLEAEMNIYHTFTEQPVFATTGNRMAKRAVAPVRAPVAVQPLPMMLQSQAVYVDDAATCAPRFDQADIVCQKDFFAGEISMEHDLDDTAGATSLDHDRLRPSTQESKADHSTWDTSSLLRPSGSVDFTIVPHQLDALFENDINMKATIIKASEMWRKKSQTNLLSKTKESSLTPDDKRSERDKAFDLLDAISRSGTLSISCAEFHVVVTTTQSYTKSVIDTIVQDNVNPIVQMEIANTVVASALHGNIPVKNLIRKEDDFQRLVLHMNERFRCLTYDTS